MNNLNSNFYNSYFSHIYIEKDISGHERTRRILDRFPNAKHIMIDHYKDVFCRSGQDFSKQKKTPMLILAAKHNNLIYEGAPVCQSFGNRYFYYTSCMMNCIYNCEYCYLQGMYPSANIVIFVNIEDIFEQTEELLNEHPVYLCVSYDTDLAAFENITGYVKAWTEFTKEHKDLVIEIRTKSAAVSLWDNLEANDRTIIAFTMSPDEVIRNYEHGTPHLRQRIAAANAALNAGFPVRLCFDPVIYCRDWKKHYDAMLDEIFASIDMQKIVDVSLGTFRVSQEYLKNMRKNAPLSSVTQFPYCNTKGVYHYPDALEHEMQDFVYKRLLMKVPKEKIFLWES